MRTKSELYREARRRIESRRQMAVTLAEERKAQAKQAIPGLESAQNRIQQLGIAGIRLSLCGAPKEEVAAKEAERIQAEADLAALMAANGYGPDSLEPKFTCEKCKDSGMVNGRVCSCVGQLAREIRRAEISEESPLSLCSFESMQMELYPNRTEPSSGRNIRSYMEQVLSALHTYAERFSLKSPNLLITGNSGLGKTHASLAIAKTVLDKGFDVVYICSQQLFSQLERDRFADDCPLRDAVMEADLFILDDLGTEYVSPYVLSCFYDILNTRMLEGRPTIYTSNIVDGSTFEARYTEKLSSRLAGSCRPVIFLGDDIRPMLRARR